MNDWNTEVAGQYELNVESMRKGRGAWIFETDRGLKLLKEYRGSVKRLEFEELVLGAVAGAGHLSYPVCMLVLLGAAILGDAVNYEIGRHVGPSIFSRETRFLNKEHLLKAHAFYERHGGKAIILARFIPIVRTFAPFVAGIALMSPVKFLSFNITGAILWVVGLVSAGYFLGNIPIVKNNFSVVIYGIIIVSVLPVVIEFIRAKIKK